jgi:hypothetical protein
VSNNLTISVVTSRESLNGCSKAEVERFNELLTGEIEKLWPEAVVTFYNLGRVGPSAQRALRGR